MKHTVRLTTFKEQSFIDMAIKYKDEYNNCPWWKFKKRRSLYKDWKSALELAIRCNAETH